MKDCIDFHVNLLPDFARDPGINFPDESENLNKCFNLPITAQLNRRCTAKQIVSDMNDSGMSRAVVFSYQWQNAERCTTANATTVAAIQQYPDRLLGMAVLQPRNEHALDELDRILAHPGIIGVKMKPRWGGFSLSETGLLGPIAEMLIARNKLLLTHVSQGFHRPTGDQIGDLFAMIEAFPTLKIVGAHMAGFLGVYENYAPMKIRLANFYVDTSLPSGIEWLPALMRKGDPSRYLFATDWPYAEFTDCLSKLASVGLTDTEIEMLCRDNANNLLKTIGA